MRVGIDVGGTFTDVVVIDGLTREIVARVKVPTSHSASEGVASGIVTGLLQALALPGIDAARIAFIAHSTTQATNALLEGDVAKVGIVGLHGRFAWLERSQLRVPPIHLGEDARLTTRTAFARADDEAAVARAVDALVGAGVEAIVASEAFGVDRPAAERRVVAAARARGVAATAGHEVASTYGLRARTRTAALNAAILPRMVRTSERTAQAVTRAGIAAPLMIMRSDGGVMDVGEVARRPILTMLSGPAAGIAGALLHENVTDGIFIEVGGTSADCSVIRRGAPQMRPARIGGLRTLLRTLDVRTLAVAGGSLLRLDPHGHGLGALRAVGPRSAHIAGLGYACFTPPERVRDARALLVQPQPGDSVDYLALESPDGTRVAPTPTCAANLLGYVAEGDFARGNVESAGLAFAIAARHVGCQPEPLARAVLERAADTLGRTIEELIADYDLRRDEVELIGGGGGASALVPFTAERLGFAHRIARDAEVISPLGVALALVRDVVERTIVAPTPSDVVRVRREAFERVVAAGAAPELVEVTVEIDGRRNLVRATASGATAAIASQAPGAPAGDAERAASAARTLRVEVAALARPLDIGALQIFRTHGRSPDACVVDLRGVVRFAARRATIRAATVAQSARELSALLDDATAFGDVGRSLPDVAIAYGTRIADLGTLAEAAQVLALAEEELRGLEPATALALIASTRDA